MAVLARARTLLESGVPQRDMVLRRAGLAGVAAQLTALLSGFGVVAIAVRHVGTERYGIWVTATAAAGFLGVADAGVGNGLVNLLSALDPSKDRGRIRVVTSTAVALAVAGAVGAAVLVLLLAAASPTALFGLSEPRAGEARAAIFITGGFFAAMLPLGLLPKIHLGLREGWWGSVWSAIGSFLALVAVAGAAAFDADFSVMLLCAVGAPVAAMAVGWAVLGLRYPQCRPTASGVQRKTSAELLRVGVGYLVIQLAALVGFQTDSIVIATVLGPEHVPVYAVPMKLFAITPAFVSVLLVSLWPVYAEAVANGDSVWVRRAFRRSVGLAAAVNVPASIVLLGLGGPLVQHWTGGRVEPGMDVLLALAVWLVISSLGVPLALLLNGIGLVRFQAVAASVMALGNVMLSVLLVRRMGVAGAAWGTNLSLFLVVYLPALLTLRRRGWRGCGGPEATDLRLQAGEAVPPVGPLP